MATTTITHAPATGFLAGFRKALDAVFERLVKNSQGYACAREAERLQALSDADLARLGLTRAGIFQHAFRGFI